MDEDLGVRGRDLGYRAWRGAPGHGRARRGSEVAGEPASQVRVSRECKEPGGPRRDSDFNPIEVSGDF